jgi:hypothetical protein
MALISKSIDEETTELADAFDSLIEPQKIWRNNNNKAYLMLRAFAGGKIGITDTALALRNRFDPLLCEEADLHATARMVGTDFKKGKGSALSIIVKNNSVDKIPLPEGVYNYQSASGVIFHFQVPVSYPFFEPGEERTVFAVSTIKGSHAVLQNADIRLFRSDNMGINTAFLFSCDDNSGQLGYEDESTIDFRTRIMSDVDRQDHIKELELNISNLPSIFECSLVFNEGREAQEYEGLTLAPKELLIIITGAATEEIAKLVVESVMYATHMVNSNDVVYYHSDIYINGKYPVYFMYHKKKDFSLVITYQYDQSRISPTQVEETVHELFKPYTRMVKHIGIFREGDAYELVSDFTLPSVRILDITLRNEDGHEAPFILFPKTRIPNLTGIIYEAIETGVKK